MPKPRPRPKRRGRREGTGNRGSVRLALHTRRALISSFRTNHYGGLVLLLSNAVKEGICEGPRVLDEHVRRASSGATQWLGDPASSPSGCERKRQNSLATCLKEHYEKTATGYC